MMMMLVPALAFTVVVYGMWVVGLMPTCIACGGRGRHRDDCSFRRDT